MTDAALQHFDDTLRWFRQQTYRIYQRRGGALDFEAWHLKLTELHRLEDSLLDWQRKNNRAMCDWPRYDELVNLTKELKL